MKDRTHHTSTASPAPAPRFGGLVVSFYSDLLGDTVTDPLSKVREGEFVHANVTITTVKVFSSGNAAGLIVTGDDGNSAYGAVSPKIVRGYEANLVEGLHVMVRGIVRILPDDSRVIDVIAVHDLGRKVVAL